VRRHHGFADAGGVFGGSRGFSKVAMRGWTVSVSVLSAWLVGVCAVTAAHAKTQAPAPILPTTPDEQPPEDLGLIALTVAEIKCLFNLATRKLQPEIHHLRWIWWRRHHQARARGFHHRTRLRRQPATT
jgi:hypothetical protein